ncbi:MAG: peptidoglycan editing factor PgeF [Pseudomonadota bacterium]
MTQALEPILSEPLSAFASNGIAHGFYTRQGGVSSGIYGSLNAGQGSKDEPSLVLENRARVATDLGIEPTHMAGCYQIHSAKVITVTEPQSSKRPEADGLVTNVKGIGLAILTADCGPILLADPDRKIIGACHAGWQGALTGIAENTIDAMVELGAERRNITAVLGPCISQKNYEVGAEFKERFRSHDESYKRFFVKALKPNHYQFDLHRFILFRLTEAGVQAHRTGQCTYADEKRFFSYRRTTHRAEPDYGRQMTTIALI